MAKGLFVPRNINTVSIRVAINLINKPELKNVIKDLRVRLYKHLVKTEDDHAIKLFRDYTGIGREDE